MTGRPFRVLHIIDTFSMGGVETWLIEVLRHLRRVGSEVQLDILATSGKSGLFDEEARTLGANIIYLPYRRAQIGAFLNGYRDLLRTGYDVLHDHQGYASGWHFLMGLGLAPQRRVSHFHNRRSTLYFSSWSSRLVAMIGRRLTIMTASRIIGASQQLLDEYAIPARKRGAAQPVYCGFNPHRFVGDRQESRRAVREEFGWITEARIILNVGRNDPALDSEDIRNVKNTDFALQTAIACARRDPLAHSLFVGETNETLTARQRRVENAGLDDRIKFIGIRRDIERLMLASDAFFLPSRCEGLGMAAVEAQAAGLPVLVSTGIPQDCIVTPDLIKFKAVSDGVEAWASDILQAAAGDQRRSRAKEILASRFAIEKSVRALQALYGYKPPGAYGSPEVSSFDTGGAIA